MSGVWLHRVSTLILVLPPPLFPQVLRSSTPSSTRASTSATPTSAACSVPGSTSPRTRPRATSTCTASAGGRAAPCTRTGPATSAKGNSQVFLSYSPTLHPSPTNVPHDAHAISFFVSPPRHLLFCRVTLGKSFLQFSAMKMAHSPPGHHSVTGRPSVNGLALAEYVIYRGEQVTALELFFMFW